MTDFGQTPEIIRKTFIEDEEAERQATEIEARKAINKLIQDGGLHPPKEDWVPNNEATIVEVTDGA